MASFSLENFRLTLRAARVNCGMTLKDVADATGRCVDTISKYEVDSTNIPRDLSVNLLNLYKVPYELIFFGKESSLNGFIRKKNKEAS